MHSCPATRNSPASAVRVLLSCRPAIALFGSSPLGGYWVDGVEACLMLASGGPPCDRRLQPKDPDGIEAEELLLDLRLEAQPFDLGQARREQ